MAVDVNGNGEMGITGLNGVGNALSALSAVGVHGYAELSSVGGVGYPLLAPAWDTVNGDFGEYEAAAAAAMAEAAMAAMAWLDPVPGGGIKGGTWCGCRWGTPENGENADNDDTDDGVREIGEGWWFGWLLWYGTDKENAVVWDIGGVKLLWVVTVGLDGAVFGCAWLLRKSTVEKLIRATSWGPALFGDFEWRSRLPSNNGLKLENGWYFNKMVDNFL